VEQWNREKVNLRTCAKKKNKKVGCVSHGPKIKVGYRGVNNRDFSVPLFQRPKFDCLSGDYAK
jgi:hypothetical protein